MIMQYVFLKKHPTIFNTMTGLKVSEFDDLEKEITPLIAQTHYEELAARPRKRQVGGGTTFEKDWCNQLLATIIWLRRYPTYNVLGYFFGVSDSTALRYVARVLPILEAKGRDGMRLEHGVRKRGYRLDEILADTPEVAVVIDSFEQRIERPTDKQRADRFYSGKKKQHTLKSQIVVDEVSGEILDISPSVPGPTADMTLLRCSGVMRRLPPGVGGLGDKAYQGLEREHPQGLGATPRKKKKGQERAEEDKAYNRAFSRRRIIVENSINHLRCYEAITDRDRHHQRYHESRVVAVAGLVNFQKRSRFIY